MRLAGGLSSDLFGAHKGGEGELIGSDLEVIVFLVFALATTFVVFFFSGFAEGGLESSDLVSTCCVARSIKDETILE